VLTTHAHSLLRVVVMTTRCSTAHSLLIVVEMTTRCSLFIECCGNDH